ncbi:MAG: acyloxyacyl hydrolase [Thermodesulfobacteriota bacterium]|nr:acyloxyacyl hydrolase [Thermodesulfobacteriota bacterium]
MNPPAKALLLFSIIALVILPSLAIADKESNDEPNTPPQSKLFTKGRVTVQLVSGALFSPTLLADQHYPAFDYARTDLRISRMLNSPDDSRSLLRGNLEVILELTNSIIYKGPGNYIGGLAALGRYNLVQPGWKLVPYIQAGAGIVYTDAYKDHSQAVIGQAIEFTLEGSLGCHYLINEKWSFDAEAQFQHISNAGIANRNDGLNAFGGLAGLTYFYEDLWK